MTAARFKATSATAMIRVSNREPNPWGLHGQLALDI
jgi:hypothetical protein